MHVFSRTPLRPERTVGMAVACSLRGGGGCFRPFSLISAPRRVIGIGMVGGNTTKQWITLLAACGGMPFTFVYLVGREGCRYGGGGKPSKNVVTLLLRGNVCHSLHLYHTARESHRYGGRLLFLTRMFFIHYSFSPL